MLSTTVVHAGVHSILEGGKFVGTKSYASHTPNNFYIYLDYQSTGKILLQSMLFKVLENLFACDLEICSYQMTIFYIKFYILY